MNTLIQRALEFAEYHHGIIDHRRKYTNEKYIVHPIAVASMVRSVGGTKEMIAAALCHDTVEDTNATIEDIYREFGSKVGLYVAGLTDVAKPEDGNRATRMAINIKHTSIQCPSVKTIKLADCISNERDIVRQDPKFAITYMSEKRNLLPFLVQGNKYLYKVLSDLLKSDV